MRRRCLVYEMAGAHIKNLDNGSNCSSSMLSQSDEMIASADKQLVPFKSGGDSSRCILPGIGLHLNALATTSKDYKVVKHEILATGGQLSMPSSSASLHSPTSGQESLNKLLTLASSEKDPSPAINGVEVTEDASQATAYLASEELNQNSPKKKRHVQFTQRSSLNYYCTRFLILVHLIFYCFLLGFLNLNYRRRLEHAGESDACKRCNCKKSKCLKL